MPLAKGIVEPTDIEVDDEAVFVTGLEATDRIPLAGGAPEVLVWGAGCGLGGSSVCLRRYGGRPHAQGAQEGRLRVHTFQDRELPKRYRC